MGQTVAAVRYVVPQGETWPDGHRDDRVHEVDMAVELVVISGSTVVLSWAMDGLAEGMAIGLRDPGELEGSPAGAAVDVTAHTDWRRFLGKPISDVAAAWHVPNEGCGEMPWAFRVDLSGETGFVVALGESTATDLTYVPDAILVIFEKRLAEAYRIPAGATSSYGSNEYRG